jgi:uncharacterized protein (TIGR03663 family)
MTDDQTSMTDAHAWLFDDEWEAGERESSLAGLETAAYVVIALLAAGLRFFQLGLRPLDGGEAVQALAAYRFVQEGALAAPAGTVPALFTGNVVGFTLFGGSDIVARWLPALAGVILVLLPYGLRHRLGRGGALVASLLLALSPAAVYLSRSLDGAMLVAACGLAVAVGLINYVDTRRPGSLYLAAAALGLGLCSGPGIYTLLLIFALFGLALFLGERLLDRDTGWSSLWGAWSSVRGERGLLAKAGAVLFATFGLVAMALVLYPGGVGHAADLIGAWAAGFLPEADGNPLVYPLLLLLRYEPLILILGLVEAGRWALGRRSEAPEASQPASAFPHTAFLVFWAAAAILLILIPGHRPAGNVLWVVIPLALLAGQGAARAWRWIARRDLWPEAALVAIVALGVGVFIYLQVASYSVAGSGTTVSVAGVTLYAWTTYLILAAVALALAAIVGAVAWLWRGPGLVVAGGWLALLAILGLFGFKATWGLSVAHAADPRELMILQTTAPDVRLLVDRLEALSRDTAGDAHTLPFTVERATGPVVAWYLREFKGQTAVDDLSAPPATQAVVTLGVRDLPIGETFRGQDFPLHTQWLPWGLRGQDIVRWLLFNKAGQPVVDQQVVLWVASQP